MSSSGRWGYMSSGTPMVVEWVPTTGSSGPGHPICYPVDLEADPSYKTDTLAPPYEWPRPVLFCSVNQLMTLYLAKVINLAVITYSG